MLKPSEIKNIEFGVSVIGGYNRENVDVFIDNVFNDYEKLYNENSELAQKLKVCIEKIEEYQKDEQYLRAAIINTEKLNENALKDIQIKEKEIEQAAKNNADLIVEKAKIEAENIVATAKKEAADSIRECEKETAIKIATLRAEVDAENERLILMKKEVSDFKELVHKLYKEHLDSLAKLPVNVPVARVCEPEPEEPVNVIKEESEIIIEKETLTVDEPTKTIEPVAKEVVEEKSETQNTAEFVIEKKSAVPEKESASFEENFKFKGLKFGADFDIKTDK